MKTFSAHLCLVLINSFLLLSLSSNCLTAQDRKVNYDESAVPAYALPDPLHLLNGEKVSSPQEWWQVRRVEILEMFENEMFGKFPDGKVPVRFEAGKAELAALGGIAIRKEIKVFFSDNPESRSMSILIYLPNNTEKPVPLFLGLNFSGNQGIQSDPGISITESWVENDPEFKVTNHQAGEETRGMESTRWPVEKIIARGYGLATVYYGDIDPDFDDCFQNGVHPLFYRKGQTRPDPNEWGSIAAWAWGLSRAMDYLETDRSVDRRKVFLIGHSRLGKAALWAGATDQRFAMVISNNSGCGGAALSKRIFGETVGIINNYFPHWFCDNFLKYNDNESALPFDQHMLLALIAPRPLYVASAEDDLWADPKGEFEGALYASPVYKLLGKEGLPVSVMPPVNNPVYGTIGYHIRTGKHDVTDYDWEKYMDFADRIFK